jgi:hypothetical protein
MFHPVLETSKGGYPTAKAHGEQDLAFYYKYSTELVMGLVYNEADALVGRRGRSTSPL